MSFFCSLASVFIKVTVKAILAMETKYHVPNFVSVRMKIRVRAILELDCWRQNTYGSIHFRATLPSVAILPPEAK